MSRKKPPVGPSLGSVAAQTIVSAPSSGVRGALGPPMSVLTQPDAYAAAEGVASRSAVLHRAVRLLRAAELGPAYEDAFADWEQTGAAEESEITAADGQRSDAAG